MLQSLYIEGEFLKDSLYLSFEDNNSFLLLGSDPFLRNIIGDTFKLLKLAITYENTKACIKSLLEINLLKNIEENTRGNLVIVEVQLQELLCKYRIEITKEVHEKVKIKTDLEVVNNFNANKEGYNRFKEWVDKILVIKPDYQRMRGEYLAKSDDKSLLNYNCTNLSDLLNFFILYESRLFCSFRDIVRKQEQDQYFKDIFLLDNVLYVEYVKDKALKVEDLPNGDKAYLLFLVMIHLYSKIESSVLVWEYPEAELPISEIGYLTTCLRQAFNKNNNLFILSNNYEVIRRFSQENTLICNKGESLKLLPELDYSESLINYLVQNNC